MNKKNSHTPVLLNEVVNTLKPSSQKTLVDATLGTGGHAAALIKKGAFVIGIDDDAKMTQIAKKNLDLACPAPTSNRSSYTILHGNFKNLKRLLKTVNTDKVDGVLADLGVSSVHFDSDDRGFSFKNPNAKLDMRLNPENQDLMASDLLNALPEKQLENMFKTVLTKSQAKYLAKEVAKERKLKKIETVGDFRQISKNLKIKGKTDPSTLPFMALRIATNTELSNLAEFINQSEDVLKEGARLAIITFHSGEDQVAKKMFANLAKTKQFSLINKKPIIPSQEEIKNNPRSRSAKLRIIEKTKNEETKKTKRKKDKT